MRHDWGMAGADRYSYADQTALSRAVKMLFEHCDCSDAAQLCPSKTSCPDARHSSSDTKIQLHTHDVPYCAFEPGSSIRVDQHGKIAYSRATPVSQAAAGTYATIQLESRLISSTDLPQLSDIRVMETDGHAPSAPLPAGFRMVRADPDETKRVDFASPSQNNGVLTSHKTTVDMPKLSRLAFRVSRPNFVRHGIYDFHDDMQNRIWHRENAMCLDELSTLGGDETLACNWDSTLADLEDFVNMLNLSRPRGLWLDTVFVNYGMHMVMFGHDPRTSDWSKGYPDYRNMTRLNGMTFLHHPLVPHYCAFATSSVQGPVFIHGSSKIHCTDSTIDVERYCALVSPPDSAVPDVQWGVRFNVEMERTKRMEQSGGIP